MEPDVKKEEEKVEDQKPAEELDDFTKALITPPEIKPLTLEEKQAAARVALQGPDITKQREAEAKRRGLEAEMATINNRLAEIAKEKERYELNWVSLDDRRTGIKESLKPLTEQETTLETKEDELEQKEDVAIDPKEKQKIETERWQVATERHKVEETRWGIDGKLSEIDAKVDSDTKAYRALLAEEDSLNERVEEIKTSLTQI